VNPAALLRKPLLWIALCLGLVSAVASAPVDAGARRGAAPALVIAGHGFGHGLGLSQWGAEKRAEAGQTDREILGFYYPRAELHPVESAPIRVLVAEEPQLRVSSAASLRLRDGTGRVADVPDGALVVAMGAALPGGLALPVTLASAKPVQVDGTPYGGALTLRLEDGKVQAVETLPLEDYLVGVVSSECIGSWRPQALRAQAIASRTYALANLRPAAPFDLWSDDRSQNYHGLARHFASAAAAVTATRGEALLWRGRPIQAFFSASNGGMTNDEEPSWGGGKLPYLVSRPDPYDVRSPASTWGPVTVTADRLRTAFPQLPEPITRAQVERQPSLRAQTVTLVAADGTRYRIPAETFQERLGLRSTYLSIRLPE
jgi:stage II sporulation protein D